MEGAADSRNIDQNPSFIWSIGRGILACLYLAAILSTLLALTLPVSLVLAWRWSPKTFRTTETLLFDYRQNGPSATITLLPPALYLKSQIQDAKRPGKGYGPRVFSPGQRIKINLQFLLPESERNRHLGIFQVTAEGLSSNGKVLVHSSVPCMLRYRSWIVRYARMVVLAVPLFLNLVEEHQKVVVLPIYMREGKVPVAAVRIRLEPRAGQSVAAGLPELYEAKATIQASPVGLMGLLQHYKLTAIVWSLTSLFTVEVVLLLFCCNSLLLPKGLRIQSRRNITDNVTMAQHLIADAHRLVAHSQEQDDTVTGDLSDVEDLVHVSRTKTDEQQLKTPDKSHKEATLLHSLGLAPSFPSIASDTSELGSSNSLRQRLEDTAGSPLVEMSSKGRDLEGEEEGSARRFSPPGTSERDEETVSRNIKIKSSAGQGDKVVLKEAAKGLGNMVQAIGGYSTGIVDDNEEEGDEDIPQMTGGQELSNVEVLQNISEGDNVYLAIGRKDTRSSSIYADALEALDDTGLDVERGSSVVVDDGADDDDEYFEDFQAVPAIESSVIANWQDREYLPSSAASGLRRRKLDEEDDMKSNS